MQAYPLYLTFHIAVTIFNPRHNCIHYWLQNFDADFFGNIGSQKHAESKFGANLTVISRPDEGSQCHECRFTNFPSFIVVIRELSSIGIIPALIKDSNRIDAVAIVVQRFLPHRHQRRQRWHPSPFGHDYHHAVLPVTNIRSLP